MRLRVLIFLFAGLAFAQPKEPFAVKPPASVDAALRARIKEFFGYHVTGEYRKAEELVAEDTKDYFYTHNKPKYLSFEITRIDYSDKFTKAKATVMCEQYVMMPGFPSDPMKLPTPSTWKLEKGKWVWFVDLEALRMTPFGKMTPGAFPTKGAAAPPSLASIPTSADFLANQVQLDKNAVQLKFGESAEVRIASSAPGPMAVSIASPLPLIEAKLDNTTIPAGGIATLTLRATKGAKSGVLNVQVEPSMQTLPIQITIVE